MTAQLEAFRVSFLTSPLFEGSPQTPEPSPTDIQSYYLNESSRMAEIFELNQTTVLHAMLAVDQTKQLYDRFGLSLSPTDQKGLFCYWMSSEYAVRPVNIAIGVREGITPVIVEIGLMIDTPNEGRQEEIAVFRRIMNGPEDSDVDNLKRLYGQIGETLQTGAVISPNVQTDLGVSEPDFEVAKAHFALAARFYSDPVSRIGRLLSLGVAEEEAYSTPSFQIEAPAHFSDKVKALAESGYDNSQIMTELGSTRQTVNAVRSNLIATGELAATVGRPLSIARRYLPREALRMTIEIQRLKWQNVGDREIIQTLGVPDWFFKAAVARLNMDGHLDYVEFDHKRLSRQQYEGIVTHVTNLRTGDKSLTIAQIAERAGISERAARDLLWEIVEGDSTLRAREIGQDYAQLTADMEAADINNWKAVRDTLDRVTSNYYREMNHMKNSPIRSLGKILSRYFKVKPHGMAPFIAVLNKVEPPGFDPDADDLEPVGIPIRQILRYKDEKTGKQMWYYAVHRDHKTLILKTCLGADELRRYRKPVRSPRAKK